jgi:hypothetical protein
MWRQYDFLGLLGISRVACPQDQQEDGADGGE